MTAADLNPDLRTLIDERLDAIDRMLLRAHVSYSERRSIIGEVETQIFELLARKGDNPARGDLVTVLDSLDPPQSYLPEGAPERFSEEFPEELRGRTAGEPAESATPRRPRALVSARAVGMARTLLSGAAFAGAVLLGNFLLVRAIVISDGLIPWMVTGAAIVYLNYRGLPRLWHLFARRRHTLAADIRSSIADWLAPKTGIRQI